MVCNFEQQKTKQVFSRFDPMSANNELVIWSGMTELEENMMLLQMRMKFHYKLSPCFARFLNLVLIDFRHFIFPFIQNLITYIAPIIVE